MVRFRMLGRDVNSSPTQYRVWVVDNVPDFTGALYTGPKSGPEPFVDVVAYQTQDGYEFALPKPLFWKTAFEVLPGLAYNSQLAILNGFIYLFGGERSDIIYRASINTPSIWEDTGARLPTTLCGSQLAIVDGYMYLFGGLGGPTEEARKTIYSAPVYDPLTWTNHGDLLPKELHKAQLGISDGYLYLFGGQDLNHPTNIIWQAPVSNPLSWTNTGSFLPQNLYGSQIALIDGYFYLFGGLTQEDAQPTDNIYMALATNPTFWDLAGKLPFPACYGQFFTVADKGYLVTAGAVVGTQPYLTRVLRCDLSTPSNWIDTQHTVTGDVSQSQVAFIDDRIHLFGGNGTTQIFVADQQLQFPSGPGTPASFYNLVTRIQYQSTVDPLDLIKVLCFPYWKTDYQQ